MSDALHSQWARLAGFIVGYQATWITDIGLKTGLFQATADARRPRSGRWLTASWRLRSESIQSLRRATGKEATC